jgi:hypothetical protein
MNKITEPKYKIGDIVIVESFWLKTPTMLEVLKAEYPKYADCWCYTLGRKSLSRLRSYGNGRYLQESEIIKKV